ncbi:MAG: hypothetical protein ABSB42_00525 [Tepidisphaeraceae bacterium]
MFKMIDKLRGAVETARATTLRRYAEILALGDAAAAEQIGELQELMKQLGFDTNRALADAKAISDRAHYLQMLSSVPEKEKAKNATAAAFKKHLDEMARIENELHSTREKLMAERNRAESAYFAAERCRRLLQELDSKQWELFGIPQPTPPQPFGPNNPYEPPSFPVGDPGRAR